MDPNKTLEIIRELVKDLNRQGEEGLDRPQDAWDLAEAIENLDKWLSRGGALPKQWKSQEK